MIAAIIPARYGSTRFPGKPLAELKGKSVIHRVYEQVSKAKVDGVFVATDDQRIYDHVHQFGGKVIMTGTHHSNGTSRIAACLEHLDEDYTGIINVQGDEPLISPLAINQVVGLLQQNVQIATLIRETESKQEINSPNVVKVVKSISGHALYFSRSAIPHDREQDGYGRWYKHIGIYGFQTRILSEIVQLPESDYEKTEKLEQLRWLEHGYTIQAEETSYEAIGIDTPDDLIHAEKILSSVE